MKKGEKLYYELLRKMSGEERFKRALELRELVLKIVEDSIRNQFPNISEKELKEKIKERVLKLNKKQG